MKTAKTRHLSEQSLNIYLENLRQLIKNINFNNIIFFDFISFELYISEYAGERENKSIKWLINKIEPYIPLIVTDNNLDTFLSAVINNDIDELERLEAQFVEHSKNRFIRTITRQNGDDDWQEMTDICRTIRKYKTESKQV